MDSSWQQKPFPKVKILHPITSLQTNEKVPERLEIVHSGTIFYLHQTYCGISQYKINAIWDLRVSIAFFHMKDTQITSFSTILVIKSIYRTKSTLQILKIKFLGIEDTTIFL